MAFENYVDKIERLFATSKCAWCTRRRSLLQESHGSHHLQNVHGVPAIVHSCKKAMAAIIFKMCMVYPPSFTLARKPWQPSSSKCAWCTRRRSLLQESHGSHHPTSVLSSSSLFTELGRDSGEFFLTNFELLTFPCREMIKLSIHM